MHSPAEELDEYISEIVSKQWLFAGASIYDGSLLHEDYGKRLLGLDLECHMAGEEIQYSASRRCQHTKLHSLLCSSTSCAGAHSWLDRSLGRIQSCRRAEFARYDSC